MDIDTSVVKKEEAEKKQKKKKGPKPPKEPEYYCPHNLDERDFDENTPIHVAIHACKLDQIKLLLKAGAVHHKKCDGSYPVHVAVSMGAIHRHDAFAYDCLKVLQEHGADLSIRDSICERTESEEEPCTRLPSSIGPQPGMPPPVHLMRLSPAHRIITVITNITIMLSASPSVARLWRSLHPHPRPMQQLQQAPMTVAITSSQQ